MNKSRESLETGHALSVQLNMLAIQVQDFFR